MSQVQQIKEATNIVDVIGERLELQRAGGHYKALCPFHSEKSPSFFVSESMQRYKCFGCGESGDVITFLQKYEGMTFLEALENLAEKAGITLQKFTKSAMGSAAEDERKKILEVLDITKEYYHYLLTQHAVGEKARQYLKDRQIKTESVNLFTIGYSSQEWDSLFQYLTKKKKYSPELLEKAGLVIKGKKGDYYDRFRDRIMFPLRNHRGQVVGFSGRVLDPKIKEAKYINSPETSVYHKSAMLFGYAELLQHIRKAKWVVVVEGELDVIASTQAHVNEIVAVKGSALTEEHAKLLRRVVDRVILSMDTDSAGVEATKRAIKVLAPQGLEVRVAQIPAGKDPDDLVKQDPSLWREAVKHTTSVYAFLIDQAIKAHGTASGEAKRKVLEEVGLVLAEMSHAVEQDFYIKQLALKLNVREDLVREDVRRAERLGAHHYKKITQTKSQSEQQYSQHHGEYQAQSDAQYSQHHGEYQAQSDAQLNQQGLIPKKSSGKEQRQSRLEKYLTFLFFQFFIPPHLQLQPVMLKTVIEDLTAILDFDWSNQELKELLQKNLELLKKNHGSHVQANEDMHPNQHLTLEVLTKDIADDQADVIMQVVYQPKAVQLLENTALDSEWTTIANQLRKMGVERHIQTLTNQLKEFDSKENLTEAEEQEQSRLLRKIMKLKRATP
jgi:DNA primase